MTVLLECLDRVMPGVLEKNSQFKISWKEQHTTSYYADVSTVASFEYQTEY